MNHYQKIKELKNQRLSYIDFIKSQEGDDEDDWLLIQEINKIQKQIELLEAKTINQLKSKYPERTIEKESQLNFINRKPRDIRVIATTKL